MGWQRAGETLMDIPRCRNKECQRSDTFILLEQDTHIVIGCKTCKGVHVITSPHGWKAGEQYSDYQRSGRPEYARSRAYFFQGRHHR